MRVKLAISRNPELLDELRKVLRKKFRTVSDDPTWGLQQRVFLETATEAVNRQASQDLSARVVLRTMSVHRAPDTAKKILYKLKLRIVLRNDTGKDINVGPVTWKSGIDKIRLQHPPMSPLNLQVETDVGWSKEQQTIEVPDGRLFRTWVGIEQSIPG